MTTDTFATPKQIKQARNEYASDDIEIDDNAKTSETDEGVWVAAWVWLRHEEQL